MPVLLMLIGPSLPCQLPLMLALVLLRLWHRQPVLLAQATGRADLVRRPPA
ncbi:hypothetical protein ABZ949_33975 [Micromonospora tulbaghiae]|uniref:hypothetical protein n=1 Tax=Micromonospora tulbaghiae TaxID=479978 RepID=UPI0033FE6DE6